MMDEERIIQLLEKIEELRRRGVISQDEYEDMRARLLRRLKEEKPPERRDNIGFLLKLMGIIVIIIGAIMSSFSTTTLTTIPAVETITLTSTTTTSMKGTFLEKGSSIIGPGQMVVIEMPAGSLYTWPEFTKRSQVTAVMVVTPKARTTKYATGELLSIIEAEIATYTAPLPVTTTRTVGPMDFIIEAEGKQYRLMSNIPLISGYIRSTQPIDFYILDLENYVKFREDRPFEAVYASLGIIGERRIEFTPPDYSRWPRWPVETIRVVFFNRGDEAANVSYELNTIWPVAIYEPSKTVITTTKTEQSVSFPFMGPGLAIIVLGIILLVCITFARRK